MPDKEQQPGVLIDALVGLIDQSFPEWPDWWANLGSTVAFPLGGELHTLWPDTGPSAPDSVGEAERAKRTDADRPTYIGAIRKRLLSVIEEGMLEDFLIAALRQELDRRFRDLDDTGETDRRRKEIREDLLRQSEDPEFIAGFRERLAATAPEYASLTDEQIADRLRDMAASSLAQPTTADDAADRWARHQRWVREREEHLSDNVFQDWGAVFPESIIRHKLPSEEDDDHGGDSSD